MLALLLILLLSLGCTSCHPKTAIEPGIAYYPPQRLVKALRSAFAPLTREELKQDWAKELQMGRSFINEIDYYRAITCFKRALFLFSDKLQPRYLEIEYEMFLAYYLAGKYQDSIEVFEGGELFFVQDSFSAYEQLLTLLYDAYMEIGQPERACHILTLISYRNPTRAENLQLEQAILRADFPAIEQALCSPEGSPPTHIQANVAEFLRAYHSQALSISKAETLNAFLPGAGYLYVGQKKTAFTSFIINVLFTAAAYQLFHKGYIAGGIIVSSLELGWYLGGINGAGIEAREYNQYLYQTLGKELLIQNRLFPILTF